MSEKIDIETELKEIAGAGCSHDAVREVIGDADDLITNAKWAYGPPAVRGLYAAHLLTVYAARLRALCDGWAPSSAKEAAEALAERAIAEQDLANERRERERAEILMAEERRAAEAAAEA